MGFVVEELKEKEFLFQGNFGLEKENLRVDTNGYLAHTEHPFKGNKQIDRDFCESQTEFITGVCHNVTEAWEEIRKLHQYAQQRLLALESGKEFLWPFSNPPYVKGEDDISVAAFDGKLKNKELYRRYLAHKYGKKKMLFCGIHLNFSFSDALLREGFREETQADFQEYINQVYLDLAEKISTYSWLIVYLTAASPVCDGSVYEEEKLGSSVFGGYSSVRCSEKGYWNAFIPLLKYNTLAEYVDSIQSYIDRGQLKTAAELYLPVRLKPRGDNSLDSLKKNGINHIELRMLDLNPLSPVGIMKEDIEFIHLLLVYFLFSPKEHFGNSQQIRAVDNMKKAAEYNRAVMIETASGKKMEIQKAAVQILQEMKAFFAGLEAPANAEEIIDYQTEKVINPKKSYAVRVFEKFGDDYVKKGMALAEKYTGFYS
ncbi:MAG: hypothetical protein LUH14_05480 [Clostridiaceae bacterium]|nr:hypothetical protein [Clostridiaceae bacterium]